MSKIVERVRMTRNYFIQNCASWLPEEKHISLQLLKLESSGALSFWKENDHICVIKNKKEQVMWKFRFKEAKQ
jgi:hypothetical protein